MYGSIVGVGRRGRGGRLSGSGRHPTYVLSTARQDRRVLSFHHLIHGGQEGIDQSPAAASTSTSNPTATCAICSCTVMKTALLRRDAIIRIFDCTATHFSCAYSYSHVDRELRLRSGLVAAFSSLSSNALDVTENCFHVAQLSNICGKFFDRIRWFAEPHGR